jgi:hypothetical protein
MATTFGAMFAREDGDSRGNAEVVGYVAFRAEGSKKSPTGWETVVVGEVKPYTTAGYMAARAEAEAAEQRERTMERRVEAYRRWRF